MAGAFTALLGGQGFAADVTQERLNNAQSEPQNWLLPFGNYEGHMFSKLDQINRDNVKDLKVAFTQPLGSAMIGSPDLNLMNYGLVDDGIMFVDDGWGAIYKIDLHGGRSIIQWVADFGRLQGRAQPHPRHGRVGQRHLSQPERRPRRRGRSR